MNSEDPLLPPGFRLLRYDTIDSTNAEAKRLARAGALPGTVVWAAEQSAGRGRRGRSWVSPPGNLYTSLLLDPECDPASAAQLGFVAAVALAEAVEAIAARAATVQCKWPNDLLANGRKLAGILLESETGPGGGLQFLVLGIGVNLASSPSGTAFPATSLAGEGIAGVAPGDLLAGFLPAMAGWLQRWRETGFAPVRTAWLARAAALGRTIVVRGDSTSCRGRFVDLDERGTLILEGETGRRRFAAGEVFPADLSSPGG